MLSYSEIKAKIEKRKRDEIEFATRRPKLPGNAPELVTKILIYQAMVDGLYAVWREREIKRAQVNKIVIPAERPSDGRHGGRRNKVFEALGLA